MPTLAEVEAKLKQPARLASMAFGIGALIAGVIIRNKMVSSIFVGAGVTVTGITIASLFNPLHIVPLEDTEYLVSRHERAAVSRATGQSGSGRIDIPRTPVPAEMMGATSVDEYLTGRLDKAQLRKFGTEDVQTMHEQVTGHALNQTGDPYTGQAYQNAVMGEGINVAEPRMTDFPNVETRWQRSGGNVVGQSGTYRDGAQYGFAMFGNQNPRSGIPQYPLIPKNIMPMSGPEPFDLIRFGQNYPGQAIGYRV